jgi:hypothetical protein
MVGFCQDKRSGNGGWVTIKACARCTEEKPLDSEEGGGGKLVSFSSCINKERQQQYSVSRPKLPKLPVPHRQDSGTYVCYSSSVASVVAVFAKKGDLDRRQDLLEAARTIQSKGLEIGCPWDLKRKVFLLAKRELKKCGYKMQRCIEYIDWEEGGRLRPVLMEIANCW